MSDFRIMVCRDASEGIQPGCVAGYFCQHCQRAVQVPPTGQQALARHGDSVLVLCNPCGFKAAEASAYKGELKEVIFHPRVIEQLLERAKGVRANERRG